MSASVLHCPQHSLIRWLLKLSHACLSFDFIGTSADDSSDDLATVQIPTSWRPLFLDFSSLQLFFSLFHSLPPHLAVTVSGSLSLRTNSLFTVQFLVSFYAVCFPPLPLFSLFFLSSSRLCLVSCSLPVFDGRCSTTRSVLAICSAWWRECRESWNLHRCVVRHHASTCVQAFVS